MFTTAILSQCLPGQDAVSCLRDISVRWSPSSRCHTGFQYTPVASIATCVTPCALKNSLSSSSAEVVVAKVFTSSCTGSDTQRIRATTLSL